MDQRDVELYLSIASPEIELEVAGVYSFEGGKIRRAQIFTDREAALEAAGLSE